MPIIKILPHKETCPSGAEIEAVSGRSICSELLAHNIEIEHACEMACACTTCHIIVRKGFNSLNQVTEREEGLLDRAWGLSSVSRLSCQAIVGKEDLEVELPRYTINHAKEG